MKNENHRKLAGEQAIIISAVIAAIAPLWSMEFVQTKLTLILMVKTLFSMVMFIMNIFL